MTKTFKICDHYGLQEHTLITEYRSASLDLCADCTEQFLTYVQAFVRVKSVTGTVHFGDGGMTTVGSLHSV